MTSSSEDRFNAQPHRRGKGRVGEEEAVRWLTSQGYEILERNANTKAGEIDLVARHGETLCFVEVKARASRAYGPAVAAVTPAKQRRLGRAAALYLASRPWPGPCRFDVLGLDLDATGRWQPSLIPDAFGIPS